MGSEVSSTQLEGEVMAILYGGIDLAKSVFVPHGVDGAGRVGGKPSLTSRQAMRDGRGAATVAPLRAARPNFGCLAAALAPGLGPACLLITYFIDSKVGFHSARWFAACAQLMTSP